MMDNSTQRHTNVTANVLPHPGANITKDGLVLNSSPRFVGEEIPDIARHSFIVLGVFLMISGTFGNLLVLVTLVRCPSLHSIHYVYVANLAIADLIIEAYSSPFVMYDLILGYQPVVNNAHCVFNGFLVVTCYVTSLLTLASISFNRYMHVCQHTMYKRYVTRRLTLFLCAMVWVVSIAVGAAPLLGWGSYKYDVKTHYCGYDRTDSISYTALISVGTIALPASAVCYFNFAIFRYVKQAKIKLDKWGKSGTVNQGQSNPGMEESRPGDDLCGDAAKPNETGILVTERMNFQGTLGRDRKVPAKRSPPSVSAQEMSDNGESGQTQTSNLWDCATPLISNRSTLEDTAQREAARLQTPTGCEADVETSFKGGAVETIFFLNDDIETSNEHGRVNSDFILVDFGAKFLIPSGQGNESQDCGEASFLCVSADDSDQSNSMKTSDDASETTESVDMILTEKVQTVVQNADDLNNEKEAGPTRDGAKSSDVSALAEDLTMSEIKTRKSRRVQLLPHRLNIPHSNIYHRHHWLDLNFVSSGSGFHDPECQNVRCEFVTPFHLVPGGSQTNLFSTESSQTDSHFVQSDTPDSQNPIKCIKAVHRRPCYLDLPHTYSCPSIKSNCDVCWNGKQSWRHFAGGRHKSDTYVTAHAPYGRPRPRKSFRLPRAAVLEDKTIAARTAKRPISLKELSMIKTLFAVFVCLSIFMSPYMVTVIMDTTNKWSALIHSTCSHLAVVNNAINWMLYGLLNKSFRLGYRQVVTSIFTRKQRRRLE